MSSISYTMLYLQCSSASELDIENRLKKLGQLVTAMQQSVDPDHRHTIVLPSEDRDPSTKDRPEVAVFVPTEHLQSEVFTPEMGEKILKEKSDELELGFVAWQAQDQTNIRDFTQQELDRIFIVSKSPSDWAKEAIKDPSASAIEVPAGQASSSFLISRWRLDRLEKMQGFDLKTEMQSLLESLDIDKEAKTPWITITLIVSGIILVVTKGTALLAAIPNVTALVAYTAIGILSGLLTAGTLIAMVVPWLAAAGAAFAAAFFLLKEADNILFVVNDTTKTVVAHQDEVISGERKCVTPFIKARESNTSPADYIHAGIYIYTKAQVMGLNASFSGPVVGIPFALSELGNEAMFSVGMSCPNFGDNSIKIKLATTAEDIATMAGKSDTETEEIGVIEGEISAVVKRSETGPINWGVCIIKDL